MAGQKPRPRRMRLRLNGHGRWFGAGPQRRDERNGSLYPVSQMVKQDGKWVSANPRDGSLDKE